MRLLAASALVGLGAMAGWSLARRQKGSVAPAAALAEPDHPAWDLAKALLSDESRRSLLESYHHLRSELGS